MSKTVNWDFFSERAVASSAWCKREQHREPDIDLFGAPEHKPCGALLERAIFAKSIVQKLALALILKSIKKRMRKHKHVFFYWLLGKQNSFLYQPLRLLSCFSLPRRKRSPWKWSAQLPTWTWVRNEEAGLFWGHPIVTCTDAPVVLSFTLPVQWITVLRSMGPKSFVCTLSFVVRRMRPSWWGLLEASCYGKGNRSPNPTHHDHSKPKFTQAIHCFYSCLANVLALTTRFPWSIAWTAWLRQT